MADPLSPPPKKRQGPSGRPGKPARDNSQGGLRARKAQPGYAARQAAVYSISAVLDRRRPLEDAFEAELSGDPKSVTLEPRDRAFARLVAMTVLRRKGELQRVLDAFLTKPLPASSGRLKIILLAAAAQLLFLETPAHAAISLAVDQCRSDQGARHFASLANAVLRRVANEGKAILDRDRSAAINIPKWMFARWTRQYGEATALQIAAASLAEAPLDLSTKSDATEWAEKLGGSVLATGSVRLENAGRIKDLAGFSDGAWWVQDAAAALPVRLFGDVRGKSVADLCAAPGGKTAELVAMGAAVTAVDASDMRLKRLRENIARLHLDAKVVLAHIEAWSPETQFDGVLLDAPCSATGTIRRHPDILHAKRETDIAGLASLQEKLLAAAGRLVKPGGLLVYCTCSLEAEEGELQIERFLAAQPQFRRIPIVPGESGILKDWINRTGDLRTLPCHMPVSASGLGGMDGFFASRMQRTS